MTYSRFEDLPVWQLAIAVAERVFILTGDRAFAGQGDLANQLQRAGLSISNNIAEGFERGSTAELIAFLYYFRGSAGEVRSMLCLLDRMGRFGHLKSEISDLKSRAESCFRQIRAWVDHLQNTPIKGQRHLNDQTRESFDQQKRAESFRIKLQRVREGRSVREAFEISDSEIADLRAEKEAEEGMRSKPEIQISNLRSQISNLKSQISNLRFQISLRSTFPLGPCGNWSLISKTRGTL